MALVDVGAARRAGIETFGDPVLYQPAGGVAFTLALAVYMAPPETFDLGSGEAVASTTAPTLGVNLADFPEGVEPKVGDTLVRQGVTWRVADVKRDGEGGATLPLHRYD